jgi:hypothetical protein
VRQALLERQALSGRTDHHQQRAALALERLGQALRWVPLRSQASLGLPGQTDLRSPGPVPESVERRRAPVLGRVRMALWALQEQTDRHLLEPVQRAQEQRAPVCREQALSALGPRAQGQKDHPMPEQAPALPVQALAREAPAPSVRAKEAPALSVLAESDAAGPAREQALALAAPVPAPARWALARALESSVAQSVRWGPRERCLRLERNASRRRKSPADSNSYGLVACDRRRQCPRSWCPPRPKPGQSG